MDIIREDDHPGRIEYESQEKVDQSIADPLDEISPDVVLITDEEWEKQYESFVEEHQALIATARKKGPVYVIRLSDVMGDHHCLIRGLTRGEFMKSEIIFQPANSMDEEEYNKLSTNEKIFLGIQMEQDKQDFIVKTGVVYCSSCDGPLPEDEILESIMTGGSISTIYAQVLKISGFDVDVKIKKV